jgi:hypothetical protein
MPIFTHHPVMSTTIPKPVAALAVILFLPLLIPTYMASNFIALAALIKLYKVENFSSLAWMLGLLVVSFLVHCAYHTAKQQNPHGTARAAWLFVARGIQWTVLIWGVRIVWP